MSQMIAASFLHCHRFVLVNVTKGLRDRKVIFIKVEICQR